MSPPKVLKQDSEKVLIVADLKISKNLNDDIDYQRQKVEEMREERAALQKEIKELERQNEKVINSTGTIND